MHQSYCGQVVGGTSAARDAHFSGTPDLTLTKGPLSPSINIYLQVGFMNMATDYGLRHSLVSVSIADVVLTISFVIFFFVCYSC